MKDALSWGGAALLGAFYAAPLFVLAALVRRWVTKRPLSGAWGLWFIWLVTPLWIPTIAWYSAFHHELRDWVGAPFLLVAALSAGWSLSMDPPRKRTDVAVESFFAVVAALMAYTVFGGGYMDAMPQNARALERFRASGLNAEDAGDLAKAFDDPDPYVGYGAMMNMLHKAPLTPGLDVAYTKALASGIERTRRSAASRLSAFPEDRVPVSTSTLAALLASPDPAVQERLKDGLRWMSEKQRAAALSAAGR